ncbi:ATP-binding cassette domain-containing protein, partial [Leuconostoc lactis]|uniref:ATP-binding cassette domain-containing protein n=1 Tax=Leuconostoc lactis TaxID=1246 RepID=UPI0025B05FFF
MSPIISVSNLSKTYGSGFKALKGINLDINRGEIFALLGPNGAGKTTTFMTVCGVVRAQRGRVEVMGRDLASLGTENLAALGVGLVPEGRRLFPSLTVQENLRLGY